LKLPRSTGKKQDPYLIVRLEKVVKLDCEQYLFSSKIRGEERKTIKRSSVTVSMTCELSRLPAAVPERSPQTSLELPDSSRESGRNRSQ